MVRSRITTPISPTSNSPHKSHVNSHFTTSLTPSTSRSNKSIRSIESPRKEKDLTNDKERKMGKVISFEIFDVSEDDKDRQPDIYFDQEGLCTFQIRLPTEDLTYDEKEEFHFKKSITRHSISVEEGKFNTDYLQMTRRQKRASTIARPSKRRPMSRESRVKSQLTIRSSESSPVYITSKPFVGGVGGNTHNKKIVKLVPNQAEKLIPKRYTKEEESQEIMKLKKIPVANISLAF